MPQAFVRWNTVLAIAAVLCVLTAVCSAQTFVIGSSNTVTADPPVSRPEVTPCVVPLFSGLQFVNFNIPTYHTRRQPTVPDPGRK